MRRRLQFGVEWLLALTSVVAVALVALIAQPHWISILAIRLTLIAAIGLAAVMAIQGGPLVRAFGIGAAFPAAVGAVLAVAPLFYLPNSYPPNSMPGRDGDRHVTPPLGEFPKGDGNLIRTFGDLSETELRFRAGFLFGASLSSGLVGLGLAWLVLDSSEPS